MRTSQTTTRKKKTTVLASAKRKKSPSSGANKRKTVTTTAAVKKKKATATTTTALSAKRKPTTTKTTTKQLSSQQQQQQPLPKNGAAASRVYTTIVNALNRVLKQHNLPPIEKGIVSVHDGYSPHIHDIYMYGYNFTVECLKIKSYDVYCAYMACNILTLYQAGAFFSRDDMGLEILLVTILPKVSAPKIRYVIKDWTDAMLDNSARAETIRQRESAKIQKIVRSYPGRQHTSDMSFLVRGAWHKVNSVLRSTTPSPQQQTAIKKKCCPGLDNTHVLIPLRTQSAPQGEVSDKTVRIAMRNMVRDQSSQRLALHSAVLYTHILHHVKTAMKGKYARGTANYHRPIVALHVIMYAVFKKYASSTDVYGYAWSANSAAALLKNKLGRSRHWGYIEGDMRVSIDALRKHILKHIGDQEYRNAMRVHLKRPLTRADVQTGDSRINKRGRARSSSSSSSSSNKKQRTK